MNRWPFEDEVLTAAFFYDLTVGHLQTPSASTSNQPSVGQFFNIISKKNCHWRWEATDRFHIRNRGAGGRPNGEHESDLWSSMIMDSCVTFGEVKVVEDEGERRSMRLLG